MAPLSIGNAFAVYDAWSLTRRCRCTVKMLSPGVAVPALERRLLQEGRLLTRLDHPHLLRGYEVRRAPLLVVSRTLTGATLSCLIDEGARLTAEDVTHLAGHLASGLAYLHDLGYLHLDVKPANVILDAGLAVLYDFSLAQRARRVVRGTGTPWYMSPEQARGGPVSTAADVWGLGVTLYEAASGRHPYHDAWSGTVDRDVPLPQLTRSAPRLATRRRFPRDLARLIDACLSLDPAGRPTLCDVLELVHGLTGEGAPAITC